MFAEVVRANRQRLGLTQEELAASAGLGVRTIRKIEAGRVGVPRPATVRLLADAFGLAGADRKGFYQTAAGEPTEPRINGHVPAQIPADVSAFTGRAEQLTYLDTLLAEASDQPTAVIISALSGTAGVGKTALAVHWAHRNRGWFPDGQLYVNLRGYDPDQPTDPAEALTGLLAALGVTGQDVPHELDDRAARYRSELADRRMLIVLDNAGSVEQVRPLLPGGGSSAVVVTSRDSLAGLVAVHGAHRLELDLLPPTEAMTLLRRLTGPRVDAEPAAAATLVEQCARLPLALRVAAELAASRPTVPLAELVTELGDQRRRLDLLDGGDPRAAVRTVFSWSIQHLPPAAAATFRLLGLHSGPDIDPSAAAALAGANLEAAHRWLELLCRAHLLQSTSPGRYGMHDLLRAYATELLRTADAEADQRAARQRLFDHYLHVAHAAVQRIDPHSSRLPIAPPATSALDQDLPDCPRATAWFAAERSVLVRVVERAFQTGYYEHAWQLAWCLGTFLYRNGHWHDDITVQNVGLEAAQRVADAQAQALAYSRLGTAYGASGRNLEARESYQQALTRFRALGDHWGEATTYLNLGLIAEREGDTREGLRHCERAYILFQEAGSRAGQGRALNAIGWKHTLLGDHHKTLEFCGKALAIHIAINDPLGAANTWDSLGYAHHRLGNHQQAITCFRHALALLDRSDNRQVRAQALNRLGDAYTDAGDARPAGEAWRGALDIFEELEDPEADGVRTKLGLLPDEPADGRLDDSARDGRR